MRIAFDVMGTLKGPNSGKIRRLFLLLARAGHEMTVWSSDFSYAQELAKEMTERLYLADTLKHIVARTKFSKNEAKDWDESLFDLAIDDDEMSYWLGAKHIILVKDIPEDVSDLIRSIEEGAYGKV